MRADGETTLGSTGVSVTRLGLGTAPLGNLFEPLADGEGERTCERAWDRGLRFFDTAPLYGYGLAEQRLGRALATKARAEATVATKVGRRLRPATPADAEAGDIFKQTPSLSAEFDFSYDGVMRSIEDSLERLGLDRLDVLHIHDPDDHYEQALSGAFPALASLRSEGVIGAVGAGMNQAAMLARLGRDADFDCFLLAGRYTLLDHDGLADLLSVCEGGGISLIVGGVYNSGILAEPNAAATFDYQQAPPSLIERARRLQEVCERHATPLKAAAIQFPLGSSAVASVLCGCRSQAEVEDNVQMFETPIPDDLWLELRAENLISAQVPVPAAT